METFRVLGLLINKNFIVRKRNWKSTLFLEFLIPIGIIALWWASIYESRKNDPPSKHEFPTYYALESENNSYLQKINYLMHNNYSVYYTPDNIFTKEIISGLIDNCVFNGSKAVKNCKYKIYQINFYLCFEGLFNFE